MDSIKSKAFGGFNSLKEKASTITMDSVKEKASGISTSLKEKASNINMDSIKDKASEISDTVKEKSQDGYNAIKSKLSGFPTDKVKKAGSDTANYLVDKVTSLSPEEMAALALGGMNAIKVKVATEVGKGALKSQGVDPDQAIQQVQEKAQQKVADHITQSLGNEGTTDFIANSLVGGSQSGATADLTKQAVKGAISSGLINGDTLVKGITTFVKSGGDHAQAGSAMFDSMKNNVGNMISKQ